MAGERRFPVKALLTLATLAMMLVLLSGCGLVLVEGESGVVGEKSVTVTAEP